MVKRHYEARQAKRQCWCEIPPCPFKAKRCMKRTKDLYLLRSLHGVVSQEPVQYSRMKTLISSRSTACTKRYRVEIVSIDLRIQRQRQSQKAKDKSQKAKDKRQKTKGKRQKAKAKKRKTEKQRLKEKAKGNAKT